MLVRALSGNGGGGGVYLDISLIGGTYNVIPAGVGQYKEETIDLTKDYVLTVWAGSNDFPRTYVAKILKGEYTQIVTGSAITITLTGTTLKLLSGSSLAYAYTLIQLD